MNAKISVFVTCVKAIIYLLLYNLHDCTFNFNVYVNVNISVKSLFRITVSTYLNNKSGLKHL